MVLGSCHSLMNVAGDLVGDPLEQASFSATAWLLTATGGTPAFSGTIGGSSMNVQHVVKHHFNSELKRMSVIARVVHKGQESYYVFAKGAPEVMQRLMKDCPPDFEARHRQFAAQGSRMIALACKQLPLDTSAAAMKKLARDEVRPAFVAVTELDA